MSLRFGRRRWNVPVKTGNFNASASNHAVHHEPEFIGVPPPQPPQPVEIRADRSACTGWAGTGVCSRSSSAIACSRFGHKPSACPPERFEASALLARKVYIQPTWVESGRATVASMKVASKAPAASAVITPTVPEPQLGVAGVAGGITARGWGSGGSLGPLYWPETRPRAPPPEAPGRLGRGEPPGAGTHHARRPRRPRVRVLVCVPAARGSLSCRRGAVAPFAGPPLGSSSSWSCDGDHRGTSATCRG